MSDNRNIAADLLATAGRVIMKERPGVHGSAENSFQMIAELWSVYINHAMKARHGENSRTVILRQEDVAEMMSMLKKGRKIYGDILNKDNDVDDIGYVALSGMLRLPDLEDGDPAVNKETEDQRRLTMDHKRAMQVTAEKMRGTAK